MAAQCFHFCSALSCVVKIFYVKRGVAILRRMSQPAGVTLTGPYWGSNSAWRASIPTETTGKYRNNTINIHFVVSNPYEPFPPKSGRDYSVSDAAEIFRRCYLLHLAKINLTFRLHHIKYHCVSLKQCGRRFWEMSVGFRGSPTWQCTAACSREGTLSTSGSSRARRNWIGDTHGMSPWSRLVSMETSISSGCGSWSEGFPGTPSGWCWGSCCWTRPPLPRWPSASSTRVSVCQGAGAGRLLPSKHIPYLSMCKPSPVAHCPGNIPWPSEVTWKSAIMIKADSSSLE